MTKILIANDFGQAMADALRGTPIEIVYLGDVKAIAEHVKMPSRSRVLMALPEIEITQVAHYANRRAKVNKTSPRGSSYFIKRKTPK